MPRYLHSLLLSFVVAALTCGALRADDALVPEEPVASGDAGATSAYPPLEAESGSTDATESETDTDATEAAETPADEAPSGEEETSEPLGIAEEAGKPEDRVEARQIDDGPKFRLVYRFHPGEVLRYEIEHQANIKTTISGSTQTADTSSKSVKVWHVGEHPEPNRMVFEHMVEKIDMRHTISGRQEIRYNSETDREPPAGYEDAAKAVGVPLAVVTIDPTGHVVHRLQKHIQPGANATSTQVLYPLPAEPIATGHVWTMPQDIDVSVDGAVKRIQARQRFELLSVSDKLIAKVEVQTQVLTPNDNPKIQAQLIQRVSKGSFDFDLRAGRMVVHRLEWDEQVLGFSGGGSLMHYVSNFNERLADVSKEAPQSAQRAPQPTQRPAATAPQRRQPTAQAPRNQPRRPTGTGQRPGQPRR